MDCSPHVQIANSGTIFIILPGGRIKKKVFLSQFSSFLNSRCESYPVCQGIRETVSLSHGFTGVEWRCPWAYQHGLFKSQGVLLLLYQQSACVFVSVCFLPTCTPYVTHSFRIFDIFQAMLLAPCVMLVLFHLKPSGFYLPPPSLSSSPPSL